MSSNPYDWTPDEVNAAWQTYVNAPDTATKAELKAAMNAARESVRTGKLQNPWETVQHPIYVTAPTIPPDMSESEF